MTLIMLSALDKSSPQRLQILHQHDLHAVAAYPFQWKHKCELIANAIEASTGHIIHIWMVSQHLSDLSEVLREIVQVAEDELDNNVVMGLLAQLRTVDGYARDDFLYRFLDIEAVWHNNGNDMRGLEVLLDSCSIGFKHANKSVRIQIPPSVVDISRYLRRLTCGSGIELQFLQIGFDDCRWTSSRDKYRGKRWREEMESFLDEIGEGKIDVVLEIYSVKNNSRGMVYPTVLLKRRGWKALKFRGHKWEASKEARCLNKA